MSITIAGERFEAGWRRDLAPRSCERLEGLLPLRQKLIHARWSGEACWVPLGPLDLRLDLEHATSTPEPGQVLLYPGGESETEILIAYGAVRFAAACGPLTGAPVLAIRGGLDRLVAVGREVLWGGAREVVFEAAG